MTTFVPEAMTTSIPVVCDFSDAPDTPAEREGAYQRLFSEAFVGKERTADGIRFRFRAEPGIEERVRELIRLEVQCCAFMSFAVNVVGNEVLVDSAVPDDDAARAVLEEWYKLPDFAVSEPAVTSGCGCESTPNDTLVKRRVTKAAIVGVLCVVGCAVGPVVLAALAAVGGAAIGMVSLAVAAPVIILALWALKRRSSGALRLRR